MKVLYGRHYGAETVSNGNAGAEVRIHETPGMRIQIRLEGWKGEKNKLVGHCWFVMDAKRSSGHQDAFGGVTEQGIAAIIKMRENQDR